MTKRTTYSREATLGKPEDGRVPVVVSTEFPVDRGDFIEVLDHSEGSVDLTRAPLPAITSHDTRKLPIGIVEDLVVDAQARVLRGYFRPGTSPDAKQVFADIVAGVIRNISIGYELLRVVREMGRVTYFAFRPFEVSAVSVPADPGAGFYRSHSKESRPTMDQENQPGERGESARIKGIVALGATYGRYVNQRDIHQAIEDGRTAEQFKDAILDRMQTRHTDTSERYIDMSSHEVQRYSLARAIVATITGDWSKAGLEREASRACEKKFGMAAEGFFVPHDVFRRDFNVGTGTEAGNLVATDLRGDLYVDALRNSVIAAPLGLRILPGLSASVDIPRKATPGSLGMLTEIGSASETNPLTAKITLAPKRIGAYVEVSKQAIIQSALALEPMLRDDLVAGAGVLIEDQIFNGVGTGVHMRGIRNTTNVGTHVGGSNGAAIGWAALLGLETACANSNAMATPLAGYAINAKARATLKGSPRGTNLDFCWPPDAPVSANGMARINGYPVGVSNVLPSNLTKGTSTTVCSAAIFSTDWSMAVLGLFGAPDVTIDPYTKADTGQVKITLNQFADFGVRLPAAFAISEDMLTP